MKPLLTTDEVAEVLRITPAALAQMRFEGRGPVYVKISGRAVGYDENDVIAWIESRKRRSTADA